MELIATKIRGRFVGTIRRVDPKGALAAVRAMFTESPGRCRAK
ncbi:hypothetical protein FHR20_002700 [Sphingomonas leidyi]|uniref:Uncharacterized protein n=1 Tax=Sphingomonas leidyi TaxID=68569 RepID=A0A7X5V0V5_9SPHN|nr:hypothetical protein [Sphingomonas leidyi]NIJ65738.1 hypothetical protein [Sphingomonas leidyi]